MFLLCLLVSPGCQTTTALAPEEIAAFGFLAPLYVMAFGEVQSIIAYPQDAAGNVVDVEVVGTPQWTSSNPAVATVRLDANNPNAALVTITGLGEAEINVVVGNVGGSFVVRGVDMEACSLERQLIQLYAELVNPLFCLFSTNDVYRGAIEHSAAVVGAQLQKNDHTSIAGYAGVIAAGGMGSAVSQVLQGCAQAASFSRAPSDRVQLSSAAAPGMQGCHVVRGNGPPPALDVDYIALYTWMQQQIPERPDKPLEYAIAFDWDKNLLNNFIPHPDFPDDHAQGADLVFKVGYDFQANEWGLSSIDLSTSNGVPQAPRLIESSVQAIVNGDGILWFIPAWTGDDEGPLFRLTTFEHDGGFGLSLGSQWAAGLHPNLGEMALLPEYEH